MGGREGLLVVRLRGAFRLTAWSTWMHNVATAWATSRSIQVNTYTNNFSFYPLPGPVANVYCSHTRQHTMPSSYKRARSVQQVGEFDGGTNTSEGHCRENK